MGMEKQLVQTTYYDLEKGQVPVELDIQVDVKTAQFSVKVTSKKGKFSLDKQIISLIQDMGKSYVETAQEELNRQGAVLGMATFSQRFPLISMAVQDPNLYLFNIFTLFYNGLKNKSMGIFWAVVDTAFKAKDGSLPDPLPEKLQKKLKIDAYKKWGTEVSKKLAGVAKKIGKGELKKNLFQEIPAADLESIIKITQETAKYYSKQAIK